MGRILAKRPEKLAALLLGLALIAAVLGVYAKSSSFGFIDLDDPDYVLENPIVVDGFTRESLSAAFSTTPQGLWAPVLWLSFMADAEVYGMGGGGFHLTNAILHAVNALLLFAFLWRATGSPWKSFFASALWALHPMRVESVAWVTERKDLLAGLFFLLCLLAWERWSKEKRALWYASALAAMLLGFMSKPILVIVPAIFLIVDFWPLGRFSGEREKLKDLLAEKIPFAIIAVLMSLTTVYLQRASVEEWEHIPIGSRLVNMATSYVYYLYETFWPVGLAMRDMNTAVRFTGVWFALSALFISALSILAFKARKPLPAAFTGWCWYLCALLPVSGIIPAGTYLAADHFTYLPHMGIALILVWGGCALAGGKERTLAALTLPVLAVLSFLSFSQLSFWKDGVTLFSHNLAVTGGDPFSEKLLGNALLRSGEDEKAIPLIEESLKKAPDDPSTWLFKGIYLVKKKRYEEAAGCFEEAIRLKPSYLEARYRLADSAAALGRLDLSLLHAKKSLDLNPEYYPSLSLLGYLYNSKGMHREAAEALEKSIGLYPGDHEPHYNLSVAAEALGNDGKALGEVETALALSPFHVPSLQRAGNLYAKTGNFGKGLEYLRRAVELEPGNGATLTDAGVLLARAGRPSEAALYFEKALALSPENPDYNLNLGLSLFEAGKSAEAARYFEKTLKIDPRNAPALYNYGILLQKSGNIQEAKKYFMELKDLYPDVPPAGESLRVPGGENR